MSFVVIRIKGDWKRRICCHLVEEICAFSAHNIFKSMNITGLCEATELLPSTVQQSRMKYNYDIGGKLHLSYAPSRAKLTHVNQFLALQVHQFTFA